MATPKKKKNTPTGQRTFRLSEPQLQGLKAYYQSLKEKDPFVTETAAARDVINAGLTALGFSR